MTREIISVGIMIVVTYCIRFLPIGLIRKKIGSSFLQSFLYYIPYTVLGAMTFPTVFYATDHFYSAFIGTIVAIGLAYFEKSLITVTVVAVAIVYGVEWIAIYL